MLRRFGFIFLTLIISLSALAADPPRLIRSLSGPSGKAVGTNFVLDETRSRFVYPRDSSLVIYFQWEATVGNHVLTGSWKQPDGRVASISPDVKVETTNSELSCYWIFSLSPGLSNGVWTLEVRVDGQPAGSHPFEIAGMEAAPKQITIDQIFRTVGPSLVWIRKLDEAGRRIDTATGFVLQTNAVGTAFQSIDAACEPVLVNAGLSAATEIRNTNTNAVRSDVKSKGDRLVARLGKNLRPYRLRM